MWSFSPTQRHVKHIKPLWLPQLRAISWALLWKGNSWLQVRESARAIERKPGMAIFFQPCASVRRYFILSIDSHSCHHPISVYIHKDSYCPAGDRPLTRSICTALVISEGHAAQPEGVQGCERDSGGQERMEEGREIKGMNSRWAFWGIAAFLRLARLATGWRRKACPLSILVIQDWSFIPNCFSLYFRASPEDGFRDNFSEWVIMSCFSVHYFQQDNTL